MHSSLGIVMRIKAKHTPSYKTITIGNGSFRNSEGEKCRSYAIADPITMLSHTHTHTHTNTQKNLKQDHRKSFIEF
jgi:hypothetical protein